MGAFRGAWPATITPTDEVGGLNEAALADLIEYLLAKGVDGFYLCGTTGEGVWMSGAERKRAVERAAQVIDGRVPFIVHVGTVGTRPARALARHAAEHGAVGVSSILPPFNRDLEGICRHYQAIAEAVPELGFYPYLFGGQIDPLELVKALRERVPNLAGAKYTGSNMEELGLLVEAADEGAADAGVAHAGAAHVHWSIYSGMDQQCLFAAMVGVEANIGSTLNFMPGVYREIHALYREGELAQAQALQLAANRVTSIVRLHGLAGALREVMRSVVGIDCGQPRLPNLPLTEAQRRSLHDQLQDTEIERLVAL